MSSPVINEQQGPRYDRLTAIQNNVRTMLREVGTPAGSSLYSGTPNPAAARGEAPRPSPGALFGRLRTFGGSSPPTNQANWQLPLNLPGSQLNYSPASQPSQWSRLPDEPQPAAQASFRHPADRAPDMDGERDLEEGMQTVRTKRHKKRRRHRREGVWTRSRGQNKRSTTCLPLLSGPCRLKTMTCLISGLFLASVLTICMYFH
jgi:hypothetical protein